MTKFLRKWNCSSSQWRCTWRHWTTEMDRLKSDRSATTSVDEGIRAFLNPWAYWRPERRCKELRSKREGNTGLRQSSQHNVQVCCQPCSLQLPYHRIYLHLMTEILFDSGDLQLMLDSLFFSLHALTHLHQLQFCQWPKKTQPYSQLTSQFVHLVSEVFSLCKQRQGVFVNSELVSSFWVSRLSTFV